MLSFFKATATKDVEKTLKKLEHSRTPIRLEVENTNVNFYTLFALQRGMIVLNKPSDLPRNLIKRGQMVRFELPGRDGGMVRMPVHAPHLQRKQGDNVFVCRAPHQIFHTKRKSTRFDTSRFNNLILDIPQLATQFRIIDISITGCRTHTGKFNDWAQIRCGMEMRFTKIAVGKMKIPVDGLVPRFITPPTISFQWRLLNRNQSGKSLEHFIKALHEKERSKVERLAALAKRK